MMRILHAISGIDPRNGGPTNALIAKAVDLCQQKGISNLVYGKYFYGNKQNSPLLEFKVRNGFREILVPRFYVPLTKWGAMCLKLKLYRGPVGLLPPSLIDMGLKVRTRLYDAKNHGPV